MAQQVPDLHLRDAVGIFAVPPLIQPPLLQSRLTLYSIPQTGQVTAVPFQSTSRREKRQIIIRTPDPTRLLADFPIPRGWLVDIDPVSTL